MKFKAAILRETNKPLEIVDLQVPHLKSGQVLVKMYYSSICGSQINEIKGLKGEDHYLPHTLGHEGYGEVVDFADDVTKVVEGDMVVVTWIKGTGLESANIQYDSTGDSCLYINSGKACTLSEYSVVSENRVVPTLVDPNFWPVAPLLGCCIPTGAGAVNNYIEKPSQSSVLVMGLGGVGLAACVWSALWSRETYGFDISKVKKMLAPDLMKIPTRKELESLKVDYVIDTTGSVAAFKSGWDCLDNGTMIVVGNPPQGDKIEIDPFDLIRGRRLIGTAGGNTNVDRELRNYAGLIKYFEGIAGAEYSLEHVNDAIDNWGTELKPIIRM